MKLNLYKLYFLTFFLLIDFVAFADDTPGDDDGGGGLEGDDPAPAPINGKLLWLAVVGILFAFYAYKRTRKTA
ncbi:hypothetical protein [Flavobacterium selenitireducens]|uniref:hypothetical protein n=1 Tax=Flavobacterium selenitireducens TaxID=2722704 RepID=UPI00168B6AAC|nr:hypothetical protein [Flavobacterium selenitireducens]MBD3582705.1 hypothetical protein [Flavobacterium selenitireducens]